ncbi:uncharacterized protein LOC131873660 isoform X2 [Cryptomeria japonica]|uniref:uncharacterized protein LOC131873660 isoform X2 n=1 Tax=Cryptomeria japonica TaxID=3369 RepID=UPI0027DA7C95|nr:uncharacterized protein LOC131873660 isoform X2 [Cryptomeria japonica]
MQIFLPCFLVTFLAGWIAWAAWTLLKEAKFKDLKYGSIPFTIIVIVWGVLKSIISVVKPVSTQMMGYINSPDHTAHLGYQQQVISDINFLKGELGKNPHWFFYFIVGEWCWNWLGLYPDNVENTRFSKFKPASEDQLRMIAFVDDLDRCDEKVIIQVLSAINLVLAECKINVILGIDKKMIQRAVETHFEDNDDRDLADKFICKIIQIPLSLPDLVVEESDKFLQRHLGHPPPTKTIIRVDDEDTDYGEIDTDNDDTSQRQESTSVEIDSSNRLQTDDIKKSNKSLGKESHVVEINFCKRLQTSCQGIIQKVSHWLACLFQSFFLLACNLTSEIQTMQDEMNKSEIRPLAFSKGARLTREMLLSKYSPKEAETLHKFKEFATGTQKLPREWKRFLDYRKIACNILSMRGKVYKLPSWRVELVAWVFVCWQWKHEINTLIKGWHKYAHVKGKDKRKIVEAEDEENRNLFGPSLKQIVKNYVMELNESQKKIDGEVYLDRYRDSRTIETQGGLME